MLLLTFNLFITLFSAFFLFKVCEVLAVSFFTALSTFFLFCLFDLILYVPPTISQLYRDESSWVEPVLS